MTKVQKILLFSSSSTLAEISRALLTNEFVLNLQMAVNESMWLQQRLKTIGGILVLDVKSKTLSIVKPEFFKKY